MPVDAFHPVSPDQIGDGNLNRISAKLAAKLVNSIPSDLWEPKNQPNMHGRTTTVKANSGSEWASHSIQIDAYGFDPRPEGGMLEDYGRRFVVVTEFDGEEATQAVAIQFASDAALNGLGMPDAMAYYYPFVPSIPIGLEGDSNPETPYAGGFFEGKFYRRTRNEIVPEEEVSRLLLKAQFMLNGGTTMHPEPQFQDFDIAEDTPTNIEGLPRNVRAFDPTRRRTVPRTPQNLPPAS